MKFRIRRLAIMIASLAIFVHGPIAQSTTIVPHTLEELVSDADFVGIIRCITAGGIVARYEVVESWKGDPIGSRFTLSIATNFWEPQFPIALVGEEFVVTASKNPVSTLTSTTMGGAVPLWWRKIVADYRTPLFEGFALARTDDPNAFSSLGRKNADLPALRREVKGFLSLPLAAQELARLRARIDAIAKPELPAERVLALDAAKTVDDYLAIACTAHHDVDQETASKIARALSLAGLERTLDFVKRDKETNGIAMRYAIDRLERRLRVSSIARVAPEAPMTRKATTPEEHARLVAALETGPGRGDFEPALRTLSEEDPGVVATWLVRFENVENGWQDHDRGYGIVSLFAVLCGEPRAQHLSTLLSAKDPFVHAAGAVYLAYEDDAKGRAALEDAMTLPGDPGAWAALALASRGDKRGVDRALLLLADPGAENMAGVPHKNLIRRLLVLLSNSAAGSNLELPYRRRATWGDQEIDRARHSGELRTWWSDHRDAIELRDPWLNELARQKID